MSRSRVPLGVALAVLLGLALVVVQRGRSSQLESPFALAGEPVCRQLSEC